MILFFTGTGNSRYAARQLARLLGDEAVSLDERMRKKKLGNFFSRRPYVLVCPVYAWRMPRLLEGYLARCRLLGNRRIYLILTCGEGIGAAEPYARAFFARIGLCCAGVLPLVMPENYLALFPTPSPAKARRQLRQALPGLVEAARLIRQGEDFPPTRPGWMAKLLSGPVNGMFYPLFVRDGGFWSTEACTGCGRCVSLCPLGNIRLEDGRPVWGGRCTHCMACIAACPAGAIQYRRATLHRRRYYLPES